MILLTATTTKFLILFQNENKKVFVLIKSVNDKREKEVRIQNISWLGKFDLGYFILQNY